MRTRVARVNQKMVDRMVRLRLQGFSYEEIGDQVGCSERTARRHTKGVSPQLVHAGDETQVTLLRWGVERLRAIQRQHHLRVEELNRAIKRWRAAVSKLDELTVEQLEGDPKLRVQFFTREVWPSIYEEIDMRRLAAGRDPL